MFLFKPIKIIISRTGIVHFRRWAIFECRWFNIYIHQILQADQDKDMHDHPWSFWSIILKGGYIEFIKEGSVRRTFLHSAYRKHNFPHKIGILIWPTWSLVITGPRKPNWGYHTDKGWVDHETYRENKNKTTVIVLCDKCHSENVTSSVHLVRTTGPRVPFKLMSYGYKCRRYVCKDCENSWEEKISL